jgi:peptide deformylase
VAEKDDIFKLVLFPNPALRSRAAEEVRWVTDEHRAIAQKMLSTMYKENGIGLSAPQVGLSLRLIVLDIGNNPIIMFNPHITQWLSDSKTEPEGCLSFPKLRKLVKRREIILVKFRDEDNGVYEREFRDLEARVIQHEIDHLNGILMIDYDHPKKATKG